MFLKTFLKRIVPFAATFILGLFVASFFVTLSVPRLQFNRNYHRHYKYNERHQLRLENQRLREELRIQQIRLAEREARVNFDSDADLLVPPPPPLPVRSAPSQK